MAVSPHRSLDDLSQVRLLDFRRVGIAHHSIMSYPGGQCPPYIYILCLISDVKQSNKVIATLSMLLPQAVTWFRQLTASRQW